MAVKPGPSDKEQNKTIKCPSCGVDNVLGSDYCEQCFHSLMQRGLPKPKKDDRFQQAIMTAPVSELLTGSDLLVAKASDSVQKIIKVLQKERKSCILIYTKKKKNG